MSRGYPAAPTSGTPPVAGAAATARVASTTAAILSRHCSSPPRDMIPRLFGRVSALGHLEAGPAVVQARQHDLVLTLVRHALGGDARLARARSRGLRHPRNRKTYRSSRGGSISVMSQVVCCSKPPHSAGARIVTKMRPPGRRSTSARGHVKPVGPHHARRSAGFGPRRPHALDRSVELPLHAHIEGLLRHLPPPVPASSSLPLDRERRDGRMRTALGWRSVTTAPRHRTCAASLPTTTPASTPRCSRRSTRRTTAIRSHTARTSTPRGCRRSSRTTSATASRRSRSSTAPARTSSGCSRCSRAGAP